MIAQVVFDLPLDGPFDYLIPEDLSGRITAGMRVKVSFSARTRLGYVVGLLTQSAVANIKTIQSLSEMSPVFNETDLAFAREFCGFYGCSLGEALSTMLRNKQELKPSYRREHAPQYSLYRCRPDSYADQIQEIIEGYRDQKRTGRFLVLVPDAFRADTISQQSASLQGGAIKIGTRSMVFECDGQYDCIMMVDEEDASYKQEQTPMYETRQVLLARSKMYGFDVAFVGVSPSVELKAWADEHRVELRDRPQAKIPPARLIDLANYKYIPGLISPPVRDALEAALKAGQKSLLILNRKGSYRLTRCEDCGEVLKCQRCDSPLIFSKAQGQYLCRYCTFTLAGDTVCSKCKKPSWRSQGIGVEQVLTELKKYFSNARVLAFERPARLKAEKKGLGDFDILISTQAVLRFQGKWQVQAAAFIDFDAELNRLDMRSAFNAFSLGLHVSSMSKEVVFIQTRNSQHYVLQSLATGKMQDFYDEEFKLRKEFGFCPFKHWVKISWRGKSEKSTCQAASQAYDELKRSAPEGYTITSPLADAISRKRDQFRFNVMVQADHVPQAVAFIKSAIARIKRPSRVIMTLNIDP